MKKFRAIVKENFSNARSFHKTGISEHVGDIFPSGCSFLEIVEQCGMIYLIRFDSCGRSVADTFHETVVAAKRQASFEFGVEDSEWEEVEN